MPSMRALMTAGPALERDPIAGFNCSFVAIDDPRAFDEILYILMCGTGVGFSVERQYIAQLPVIGLSIGFDNDGNPQIESRDHLTNIDYTIVVEDSKAGWATAFKNLLKFLYAGEIFKWDVSLVRPAGAKLVTFMAGPVALTHWLICLSSLLKHLNKPVDVSLHPLNVMTWFVRLQILLLLVVFVVLH